MKCSLKFILLSLTALFLFVNLGCNSDKESEVQILKSEKTFPHKTDTLYLSNPINMAFDKQDDIFISDQRASRILKFNKNGRFIKQIGRSGRGPGELNNPQMLRVNNNQLVVYNASQLQFYNTEGNFMNSFNMFGVENFWLSEDQIIAFKLNKGPREYLEDENIEQKFFQVFNLEGKPTGEFGEYPDVLPFKNALNKIAGTSPLLREYDNKLYVLFEYFPLLRVYDMNTHELLNEIKFEEPFNYKERIAKNYRPETYKETGTTRTKYLFKAFDVNSDGIFLGLYDENILIDQYSLEGNFIKRYEKENEKNPYTLDDLKVFTEPQQLIFYALVIKEDIPVVEVFQVTDNS